MTNLLKKSLKWIPYLLAILFTIIAAVLSEEGNKILTTIFAIIPIIIYSYLIVRDFKFLSVVSYITLGLTMLAIMGLSSGDISDNGGFTTPSYEKSFYITLSILLTFIVPFSTYLITRGGWRKKLSHILLGVSIVVLFIMGMASPTFHTNFVYTRIFIGIAFVYSIYSIFRKEKLPRVGGIMGILSSLIALLLSAFLFAGQTYTIEGAEKEKVVNFIEPKVQEMFQAYNLRDSGNFCRYCREDLKANFSQETFESLENMYGRYISYKGPNITWTTGSYYIEYMVNFEKVNPIYFTLMTEQVGPESTIYRFDLSPENPAQ